jgi:uncharacterized membrane protein
VTARLTFVASVVLLVAALVAAAVGLPEQVPLHFDGSGDADRWGSRTEALVTMSLVGAFLVVLLGGSAAFVDRLPVTLLNVPHKQWWTATPDREARLRRMMATDLYAIGAATVLLVALAVLATLRAARTDATLGGLFLAGLVVYLLVVVGWTVWACTSRYRHRSDS